MALEPYQPTAQAKEKQGVLTPNRILLASDFSASAEAALYYAAAIARQSQASLLLLHVIETGISTFSPWTDIFRASDVLAAREAAGLSGLDELAQHAALHGVSVQRMVQYGNPIDHITDAAPWADLVVMGMGDAETTTRGQAGGKVARHVAHASAVPVLLVPADGGAAALPAATDAHLTFRQVLLAINLAGYAPQAVTMATEIATACQAALLALQIVEPDKVATYPVDAGAGLHRNLDSVKVLLEKRLAEVIADVPETSRRQPLVQIGAAVESLLQQMVTHRADLVVMSAHRYGALRKFFTLSTVDAVLARAWCPLLAVPFPRATMR